MKVRPKLMASMAAPSPIVEPPLNVDPGCQPLTEKKSNVVPPGSRLSSSAGVRVTSFSCSAIRVGLI
jgi:hypothetical protein